MADASSTIGSIVTGNYGLSLKDATRAKGLKPNHMKALVRGKAPGWSILESDVIIGDFPLGSQVYLQLQRFGEAVEWCDEGLRVGHVISVFGHTLVM